MRNARGVRVRVGQGLQDSGDVGSPSRDVRAGARRRQAAVSVLGIRPDEAVEVLDDIGTPVAEVGQRPGKQVVVREGVTRTACGTRHRPRDGATGCRGCRSTHCGPRSGRAGSPAHAGRRPRLSGDGGAAARSGRPGDRPGPRSGDRRRSGRSPRGRRRGGRPRWRAALQHTVQPGPRTQTFEDLQRDSSTVTVSGEERAFGVGPEAIRVGMPPQDEPSDARAAGDRQDQDDAPDPGGSPHPGGILCVRPTVEDGMLSHGEDRLGRPDFGPFADRRPGCVGRAIASSPVWSSSRRRTTRTCPLPGCRNRPRSRRRRPWRSLFAGRARGISWRWRLRM